MICASCWPAFASPGKSSRPNLSARWWSNQVRPNPEVTSDEQAADYIRNVGSTVYHPCGTCRMGEDDAAVVDSQLRVRGIDGLRVVDASVMPAMLSPNIHPATIMVAEKSSDIIGKTLAS